MDPGACHHMAMARGGAKKDLLRNRHALLATGRSPDVVGKTRRRLASELITI
jgi:hypothetical protein